ncbi:hypothetical protein GCM10009430_43840 [Aquimarina litoralis]|uniref:Rhamnosyl O-methyltransferase n=1 Tax=Aquimarina litoralis TaxID=584605 RepID=A0ABN1J7T6_9FLAO
MIKDKFMVKTKESKEQLDGKMLKIIFDEFSIAWSKKMDTQGNVPTFQDLLIKDGLTIFSLNIDRIHPDDDLEKIFVKMENFVPRENIEAFVSQIVNWYYGRYVNYDKRTKSNPNFLRKSSQDRSFSMSQGQFDCLKWKDTILFKTVYDLAIYQMLIWDLKPKTILEIGSGTGGSAVWMSDLIAAYGFDCQIISFDINPPSTKYKNVTFLKGDSNKIDTVLTVDMLKELPHPWLIIEDAHVNVHGVLSYFHRFMDKGDYLIVEDSGEKQEVIARFLEDKKQHYLVDALYCDFFGHNVTCSYDSIFRRT